MPNLLGTTELVIMRKKLRQASYFGLNLAIFFAYILKYMYDEQFAKWDVCKENGQIQTKITCLWYSYVHASAEESMDSIWWKHKFKLGSNFQPINSLNTPFKLGIHFQI